MLHHLDILHRHQAYTLVVFKHNGYPLSIKMQFNRIIEHSERIVFLKYHPYNRLCGGGSITITKDTQFILWEGYVEAMVDMAVAIYHKDDGSSGVKMMKKYSPFNGRYMQRALLSVKNKPLLMNIKPLQVNDRLLDICTVIG